MYWFQAKDLVGIQGLPNTASNITRLATKKGWDKRQVKGGKGVAYEYPLTALPPAVQAAVLFKYNPQPSKTERPKKAQSEQYSSEILWELWDKSTEKQRQTAQRRHKAVSVLISLIEHGTKITEALKITSEQTGEPVGSLKNWYYRVRKFSQHDRAPALLPNYRNRPKQACAKFSDEAWEFFKADYFRAERPQFGTCYHRLQMAAKQNGWEIPSDSSVQRKIAREIPKQLQVLWRDGERALADMYPAQVRTVESLEAMEWINGDGYQHNVFVEWPNGEIVRPKTWLWQDVRTRKILGYRTDLSENSDTIRLSLMDVVSRYGIPKKLTIDNTRAAANK